MGRKLLEIARKIAEPLEATRVAGVSDPKLANHHQHLPFINLAAVT